MIKYFFKFICIIALINQAVASDFISDTCENGVIIFDDFPENSIPDLEQIDEDGLIRKEFHPQEDFEEAVDLQSALGTHSADFPNAIVKGCVNVITGEFQEKAEDFSLAGHIPFDVERSYHSGQCLKQSLHYGWQLNHGGKLFTWKKHGHLHAYAKGGVRQGAHYKGYFKDKWLTCWDSFFDQWVSNCSLGEINAANNFKNDRLYHNKHSFSLITADKTSLFYSQSSHDAESQKGTRCYHLKHHRLASGGSYKYQYHSRFGMPISLFLLDRSGQYVADVKLDKIPTQREFINNPELIYNTSTNEKIRYRFMLYGDHHRAILSEVVPPHAPKVQYRYLSFQGHKNKKKLYRRELPDQRILEIAYDEEGRVRRLFESAGAHGQLLPTYHFSYRRNKDERSAIVTNALGGVKKYHWNNRTKRLDLIETVQGGTCIFAERFKWGGSGIDKSHLSEKTLEDGNGHTLLQQKYQYDAYGNVLSLSLQGNLTGNSKDVHTTTYQYDSAHRKIYENNKRNVVKYSYLDDTKLVSARYCLYRGRIQTRHFYEYDATGAVTQEIVDDGSSESKDDLSHITERLIKFVTNSSLGLPVVTEEYAFNIKTGQNELILKTVNAYDHHGWLIQRSVYDAEENLAYTLEWKYDSHGNVVYQKDALGNVTECAYDANDNLISELKPDCAPRQLAYDCMNRLVKETWILSPNEEMHKSYCYDALGNCLSTEDIYGNGTSHEYDSHGRLVKTIYPSLDDSKPAVSYTRNALGFATAITDANGHTKHIEYNVRGKPIQITYADGSVEKMTYTLWGELSEQIFCDGTKVAYTYDPKGREVKKEWFDPQGQSVKITSKAYNAFHLISETDGNGVVTYYEYDAAGRLSFERTKEHRTYYSYDRLGRLTATTKSSVSYVESLDLLGRVIESYTTTPQGEKINAILKHYDAQGREIRCEEQNQAISTKGYDLLGREVRSSNALGETTDTSYHIDGKKLRHDVIDCRGVKKSTTYDPFGRPILEQLYSHLGLLVEETAHIFDPNGNKILRRITTHQEPIETKWEYDALNRLTKTMEAAGTADQKCVEHVYNAAGLLVKTMKNDGTILSYSYDALRRKILLKSSDGSIHYSFDYDKNDNLIVSKDEIRQTAIQRKYDWYNQLVSETLPSTHQMQYVYDELGNITLITFPDQSTISYHYDGNRLASIHRNGALSYSQTYEEYDPSSNPTIISLPENNGNLEINYDLLHRPTSLKTNNWEETLEYGCKLLRKRSLKDAFGEMTSCYTYDAKKQLLTEDGVADHRFQYDWQDNMVCFDETVKQFNACNALIKSNEQAYTYDLNGNRLSDGVNHYSYDALDRLIEVTSPTGTFKYIYDALNRRVSKENNSDTTHFLWQMRQEIGAISSSGEIKELKVSGTAQAMAFELNGSMYVPVNDIYGHVRTLLDPSGNSLATYRYSAYGQEEMKGNVLSPWRYAGKRCDPETGFIYYGERFYDPKTQCWLTPDPIGDMDGPNQYRFVYNNPMLYTDPDGRLVVLAFAAPLSWAALEFVVASFTLEAATGALVGAILGIAVYEGAQQLDAVMNQEAEAENKSKRHTGDQQAISNLVKGSRKKGISNQDADTLLEWAKEYDFPARDDRGKRNAQGKFHWEGGEHIHLGPEHVPVN